MPGGKPISAQAELRYVEHEIGEDADEDSQEHGEMVAGGLGKRREEDVVAEDSDSLVDDHTRGPHQAKANDHIYSGVK